MTRKTKLYKYNFFRIIFTIILFPIIVIWSKKLFKSYRDFCYIYPRFGEFTNKANKFHPKKVNTFEYHLWDLDKMNLNFSTFNEKNLEEFELETEKGKISCLKAVNKISNKWVIGLHGWTEDKYLALRLVHHFYDKGYNVLTFDAFAHGKSYGQYTDIGFSSIEMIDQIIVNLKEDYQIDSIGLIGNSMGASTSLLYSQVGVNKDLITWVIADCGFSNIKFQYRYYLQNNFFKKSWWLTSFGYTNKFSKITKTNQNKYNLLKNMNLNKNTPVFFIHAIGDTFIPYEMSLDMYNKKIEFEIESISSIWTPQGSEHVSVIADYYDLYIEKTLNFAIKGEEKKYEK
ncbi:alpha/beta hydrolase [Spiroplasma diminutum]|uniref:Putative hydrolase n=1 Tax=Spiroplasma diminutum CUAS-1 TaxID=1276221 RepID=S5M2F1_9MOLU|nr:alpha/beta hydrolase [Spiroplasma diminutum]AGR42257.1 putative hydrolase [Spiroplasma diminutum CUAS-1]